MIQHTWLGNMDYEQAWGLQKRVIGARVREQAPDTLLLLEHPHTYTVGRRGSHDHILLSADELTERGVAVYDVDRGGDVTYHGPGQLVGYPILQLAAWGGDVVAYVRRLEAAVIMALRQFGIAGERSPGFSGVWLGADKVCAVGVRVEASGVSSHGFAINVDPDLGYFAGIVPCGLVGKGVTSMARLLGRPVSIAEARPAIVHAFGEVFGAEMSEAPLPPAILAPPATTATGREARLPMAHTTAAR